METTHNIDVLPEHARLIADPDVWIEGEAVDQLARIAKMPNCISAVGLPDLHPGPGFPIGAAFAFRGVVRPGLVGGDAGCGVRVFAAPRVKAKGDALERRALETTGGQALPDADLGELLEAAWHLGPRGLAEVRGVPDTLAALAEEEPEENGPFADLTSGEVPDMQYGYSLGSVGGGNHFLEASRVGKIVDKAAAASVGLKRGGFAVMAHSGSRGLGKAIAKKWGHTELTSEDATPYLRDLIGAIRYARTNRLVLCWRLMTALGIASPNRISGSFDVTHNTVVPGEAGGGPAWIHRKGAAPAEANQLTAVLGSRGTPTWIMAGTGCGDSLCSVAHGAGRRMNRGEAVEKMRSRYRRTDFRRTATGGRVICDDPRLLYAEHPDVYKAIEPVITSLETVGAARRVASLIPMLTVKR